MKAAAARGDDGDEWHQADDKGLETLQNHNEISQHARHDTRTPKTTPERTQYRKGKSQERTRTRVARMATNGTMANVTSI